jgi:PhzF family phenazine biosynthesis protein
VSHPFQLVDVFGQSGFSGNPLAVIFEGDGLDTDAMQAIAQWLNLSETTFLCQPTTEDADYRVRIFTLDRELPFAGHPTLGTCHAWLTAGGQSKRGDTVVQECGVGLVPIRRADNRLAFAAPPLIRSGAVDAAILAEVAEILRIAPGAIVDASWIDNGPGWIGILLESADAVLALEPARAHGRRIEIGVIGAHPPGSEAAFEIRAIFSDQHGSLIEDPVTGSLNASVAQWLFARGTVKGSYVAAQGTRLGRQGRVLLTQDDTGQVWVAGATKTLFEGQANL